MPEDREPLQNVPILLDPLTLDFQRSIVTLFSGRAMQNAMEELLSDASRGLLRPETDVDGTCDAIIAATYIGELLVRTEVLVAELARGYSQSRWLWYLRRLPQLIFAGNQSTTYGYDSALADVASARFGKGADNARLIKGFICYPIEGAAPARVLRFCYGIKLMSQLQMLLRYAGKGIKIRFRDGRIPSPVPTSEEESAIQLYDRRNSALNEGFLRGGTNLASVRTGEGRRILAVMRLVPSWERTIARLDGELRELQVFAHFAPQLVDFDGMKKLLSDPRLAGQKLVGPEIPSIFALLSAAPAILEPLTSGLAIVMQRGYLPIEFNHLKEALVHHLAQTSDDLKAMFPDYPSCDSADKVLREVSTVSGSLWPLRLGPIIRRSNDRISVDFYAATAYLDAALEFPRSEGDVANARAEHFEEAVQGAIDLTKWAPSPEVRRLRRRELRLAEEAITDIDAIGTSGDTLMLISCKSLIYSAAYDMGNYQAVRNASSTVAVAVADWDRKVRVFRNTRQGDNYDFSQFSNLLAVVCTPHPIYTPLGAATSEIRPNLRAAACLEELVSWLQNN